MTQKDIAAQVIGCYKTIMEQHGATALDGLYTDHYERPVIRSLLGDVAGLRVLDAGCGPGVYAEWLVAQGAQVLALDASPEMVQSARQRLGDAVDVRQADLNRSLDFISADAFDVVLSTLTLDYIRDWDALLKELDRVLVPSGRFIFSVYHPFFLDLKLGADVGDDYFSVQLLEEDWRPFGVTIPAYRRPLGAMTASLGQAGFLIEQIVEPRPTEASKERYPEHYEKLSKHPVFICFSTRKGRE